MYFICQSHCATHEVLTAYSALQGDVLVSLWNLKMEQGQIGYKNLYKIHV